jgi:cytochrome c
MIALGVAIACATSGASAQGNQGTTELKRGETLVTRNCARCHATTRTGESTHPEAPAFRTLGKRYPIESLEEALGEGIISGHPDMPEFVFESTDVGAIIAYLKSIQEPKARFLFAFPFSLSSPGLTGRSSNHRTLSGQSPRTFDRAGVTGLPGQAGQ